ncbi:MAG: hypothetical protein ACI399_02440 [Candidatus Cryptobacteroides sp.]
MKKIFKYIAFAAIAASALVSCRYGEDEISNPADEAPAMTITIGDVTDNACTFTIAPSGQASYYSYSVVKGLATETPDASKLYSVTAGGISKGTFKYADKQSATIELTGLANNSDYTIFAVAGSPEGAVGIASLLRFHTPDTELPSITDAGIEDGSLILVFDEDVTYNDRKTVQVDLYASSSLYYQHPYLAADKLGEFTLAEGTSEGNVVVFPIPEDSYIDGALLAVSFEDGTFIDVVGNKVEGIQSYVFGNYYVNGQGWYPETYGVVIETEPGTFDLGDALEIGDVTTIVDEEGESVPVLYFPIESGIGYYFSFNSGYLYYTVDWNDYYYVYGTVVYSQVSEDGRVSYKELVLGSSSEDSDAVYDLIPADSGDYGVVYLLEEPLAGDTVTITIPEYAYVDQWGRYNNEKTFEFVYQPSAE